MNSTPLNIFELLLNSNQLFFNQILSVGNEAGASSVSFDELIKNYLSQGSLDDLSGVNGNVQAAFEQLLAGTINEEPRLNELSQDFLSFNKDLQQLNLNNNPAINKNLKNLFNIQQLSLPEGKYEITQSDIIEGKLNLELKQQNSETIKVSLPLDQLKNGIEDSALNSVVNSRMVLDSINDKTKELNELFSKLQLKEIEVENIRSESDKQNNIKLNIIAENKGVEFTIRNNLNKIHLRQSPDVEVMKNDSPEGFKGAVLDKSGTWNNGGFDIFGYGAANDNKNGGTEDNLLNHQGLFEKAAKGADNFVATRKSENSEAIFNYNKLDMSEPVKLKDINLTQARLDLPENLNSTLKVNGQSVMIKICPDHLGPARLKLTMVDSELKARLIVSSHAAKTVLENSVDRLIDQLQKADIKVDLIDITVSGDSTRNELANRQSHWQRKLISRNLNDSIDNNISPQMIPSPAQHSIGSIGSGGVNLLA